MTYKIILGKPSKQKKGKCQLRLRMYQTGESPRYFSTTFYVKPSEFNKKNESVIELNEEMINANLYLKMIRSKAEQFVFQKDFLGEDFSIADVIEYLKPSKKARKNENCFLEYIVFFRDKSHDEKNFQMKKRAKSMLGKLKGFVEKETLLFHELSLDFWKGFIEYCRNKGNQDVTIEHNIKFYRARFNDAREDKLHKLLTTPFTKSLQLLSVEEKIIMPLSKDEMNMIENFNSENKNIQKWRDLFLFGIYTGLRFRDIVTLKKSAIMDGYILRRQSKTKNYTKIPLAAKSLAIIEKYKKADRVYCFGVINRTKVKEGTEEMQRFLESENAMANMNLKRIMKKLNIHRNITFHFSRHTCASMIYDITDGDILTAQRMLGHRSSKTTERYTSRMIQRKTKRVVMELFG